METANVAESAGVCDTGGHSAAWRDGRTGERGQSGTSSSCIANGQDERYSVMSSRSSSPNRRAGDRRAAFADSSNRRRSRSMSDDRGTTRQPNSTPLRHQRNLHTCSITVFEISNSKCNLRSNRPGLVRWFFRPARLTESISMPGPARRTGRAARARLLMIMQICLCHKSIFRAASVERFDRLLVCSW